MVKMLALAFVMWPLCALAQGSVVVRVEDPSGSHCIDATTEAITIHVRRIFIEKRQWLFTQDARAAVLVSAKLTGRGTGPSVDLQIPSITILNITEEAPGRVSLPLEYQIASDLPLAQDRLITTDIELGMSLAKVRARNWFGELIELAGRTLGKLPVPNNPYVDVANKFLAFANDTIQTTVSSQLSTPFAQVSLAFNRGREPDIRRCASAGKERTGAIAVLLSTGLQGADLIPVVNTEQHYCFKYSSFNTYELLAAERTDDGSCPTDNSRYSGVNNDYAMFLISAQARRETAATPSELAKQIDESRERCLAFHLEPKACGVGQ